MTENQSPNPTTTTAVGGDPSESILSIRGLTRTFGTFTALNNVTFDVPRGTIFGLVGPNGAGKTTMFSIVAGFLQPTQGSIELLGSHAPGATELLGRVSILPQDALFDRNLMILDQLVLYRRLQGATGAEAKAEVADALTRVGLGDYLERGAGVLSHGMTKRLGIAQAFLGNPDLIILDEPTAGLDPRNAKRVRDVIRELSENSTVIVSSHNLAELEDLCDHVVILDRGVVRLAGTMTEAMQGGERRFEVTFPEDLTEEQLAEFEACAGVVEATGFGAGRYEFRIGELGDPATVAFLETAIRLGILPVSFRDGTSLEEIFLSLTGESPE